MTPSIPLYYTMLYLYYTTVMPLDMSFFSQKHAQLVRTIRSMSSLGHLQLRPKHGVPSWIP